MKQIILVRKDLKMPAGKLAAQCCHAAVEAVLKSKPSKVEEWKLQGMPKIILEVKDVDEIKDYQDKARREGLTTALIRDAGRTFFKKPTITCLAIGPDREEKIDKIVSKLKLL